MGTLIKTTKQVGALVESKPVFLHLVTDDKGAFITFEAAQNFRGQFPLDQAIALRDTLTTLIELAGKHREVFRTLAGSEGVDDSA